MYLLNGFLVFCLLLFCPLDGFAKMYKWVDKDGQVHFTDRKLTEEETELKEFGKDGTKEPQLPEEETELKEFGKDGTKEPPPAHFSPSYSLDLKILDIKVKFLERSHIYVEFALRVKVQCTDPRFRGDAKVWLRALDRKGLELETETASGKIVSRGPAILSGKGWMKYKLYRHIDKWEVTSISFD